MNLSKYCRYPAKSGTLFCNSSMAIDWESVHGQQKARGKASSMLYIRLNINLVTLAFNEATGLADLHCYHVTPSLEGLRAAQHQRRWNPMGVGLQLCLGQRTVQFKQWYLSNYLSTQLKCNAVRNWITMLKSHVLQFNNEVCCSQRHLQHSCSTCKESFLHLLW